MDVDQLFSLTEQLRKQAQPRPDLLTPGSTGQLENARPMTIAGRVLNANNIPAGLTMDQLIKMPAQDSPDAEGLGGTTLATLGSASATKGFSPGERQIIRGIARRSMPELQELQQSPKKYLVAAETPAESAGGVRAAGSYVPYTSNIGGDLTHIGGKITVNPKVLKGINPATGKFGGMFGDLPGTAVHEGQHGITPTMTLSTSDPESVFSAWKATMNIAAALPPNMARAVKYDAGIDLFRGYSEALSYLREASTGKNASQKLKDLSKIYLTPSDY